MYIIHLSSFHLRQYKWMRLMDALKQSPARISVAGVLGTIAYLLAVFAYSISPVSYAGALAGWWFLKERMGGVRVLGAVIIFTGILVIAIFG